MWVSNQLVVPIEQHQIGWQPPFRHANVPPFRHANVPPFRHANVPPFRHANVPPFRQGFTYEEMYVTQQVTVPSFFSCIFKCFKTCTDVIQSLKAFSLPVILQSLWCLNDIKLILNDNLRVKSTVRGEDQEDVGLFRILKIKMKDYGTKDPSIRAVLFLCHYKYGVWCNSCHVGLSDTVISWQCHESVVIFKTHSKSKLIMIFK